MKIYSFVVFVLLMVVTASLVGRPPDEIDGRFLIWHSDSQHVWADSCTMVDSTDTMHCDYFADSNYCSITSEVFRVFHLAPTLRVGALGQTLRVA